ncbi:MAG: hypothetical protein K8R21_01495 [Leptospira sp.]|nr:hypothetical protein [Leptospira sp.]
MDKQYAFQPVIITKSKGSFLKESFKEDVWYKNLKKRPGIENIIPYFRPNLTEKESYIFAK